MSAPLRTILSLAVMSLLNVAVDTSVAFAQMVPSVHAKAQAGIPSDASAGKADTFPNGSPPRDWPSPVDDQQNHLFTLFDVLEYRPSTSGDQGNDDFRWVIVFL